jgi:hypothetical protein
MTTKRSPRRRDPVHLGKLMIDIMTGQIPDAVDAGAVALGRKGGAARAGSMIKEQRAEIARKGAAKRWSK